MTKFGILCNKHDIAMIVIDVDTTTNPAPTSCPICGNTDVIVIQLDDTVATNYP